MDIDQGDEGYHFSVMRRAIDLVDQAGPCLLYTSDAADE